MSYDGELYANYLVRSVVHKIASYCSMIRFEHVRGSEGTFEKVSNSNINRLLTVKPNSLFMTPSQMWYKFHTDLWTKNNAYLWIQRDGGGKATALIPVISNKTEMIESNGFLFYKFYFKNGEKLLVPMEDIYHARRYYYQNDWFGEDNSPLRESVGLVDNMNKSVNSALKNGANLKGILKHQNTISPEDLEEHQRLFTEQYLKPDNNGGIGMIDAKFDFIPTNFVSKITDAEQMREIRDYVYRYFNVNDDIMLSKYNSDTWQSFHEGTIAPVLNDIEEGLRIHLFTDKELGYNNRIASSVNSISFMSAQQKINMVKFALDGALYNRNEIREWFGDSPIPGGDVYQYSKNFTEDTNQNKEVENANTNGNETSEIDSSDELSE